MFHLRQQLPDLNRLTRLFCNRFGDLATLSHFAHRLYATTRKIPQTGPAFTWLAMPQQHASANSNHDGSLGDSLVVFSDGRQWQLRRAAFLKRGAQRGHWAVMTKGLARTANLAA